MKIYYNEYDRYTRTINKIKLSFSFTFSFYLRIVHKTDLNRLKEDIKQCATD